MVQENLKLATFLFHGRWLCTLDWKDRGVQEETVHKLAGKKKLEDEHRDPDILHKVNETNMAETKEASK